MLDDRLPFSCYIFLAISSCFPNIFGMKNQSLNRYQFKFVTEAVGVVKLYVTSHLKGFSSLHVLRTHSLLAVLGQPERKMKWKKNDSKFKTGVRHLGLCFFNTIDTVMTIDLKDKGFP